MHKSTTEESPLIFIAGAETYQEGDIKLGYDKQWDAVSVHISPDRSQVTNKHLL